MTPLKTGALAITLIIVIPILLGYGMASETVQKTTLEEDETVNLSNVTLNSTTDYFVNYTGPQNNSTFLQEVIYQGTTSYTTAAPDYEYVSSTYTSIPTYTSGTGTFNLTAGTIVTHSGTAIYGVYVGGDPTGDGYPHYDHEYISIANSDGRLVQYEYTVNGTTTTSMTNTTTSFKFYKSSEDTWTLVLPDTTEVEDVERFFIMSDQTPTFSVYYRDATTVNIDKTYYATSATSPAVIPITHGDSTTEYVTVDDLSSLVWMATHLLINGERYDDVSSYGLCLINLGYTFITYSYNTIVQDSYANPSYGWSLPAYTGGSYTAYYDYWTNGYICGSVIFDLAFSGYGETRLMPMATLESAPDYTLVLTYSASGLTATIGTESHFVGKYDHARVILDAENEIVTVSGLQEWGAMYDVPETYNSVSFDIDRREFSMVQMTDPNGVVSFRADTSRIVAGEFPSTEDYTLKFIDLYPDLEHFRVYINSIGIYGTSIQGNNFTVTNPLKNPVIFDRSDDDTYWIANVNGQQYQFSADPVLVFNGEWSLTLTMTTYEYTTYEETNWVPGEFAFDQDDFLLAMILTSVAVFVALGLMKGVRIGVLLVVCSAAGIIAFIIA